MLCPKCLPFDLSLLFPFDSSAIVAHLFVLFRSREDIAKGSKEEPHGHVTSVSVLRTHRKLGLATTLMKNAGFSVS
jgi:hypothetical protein